MELKVLSPGMLTTVQDLGRWGYQASGVPVAGAMDLNALRIGNVMLGNNEGAAALEVTIAGPELEISGEGSAVFAGAELGFTVNGRFVGSWRSVVMRNGDKLSFSHTLNHTGCRGCLCVSGGIDVPRVMGSRSTYMRAKLGGYEGRKLRPGDVLRTGEPPLLWRRTDGFMLPDKLKPDYSLGLPLYILTGLQENTFTKKGLETLFMSEYTVSTESDRMGCRFDGPKIEHSENGADIVSDAIPLGSVQIPGHGLPIAMLADRQTTGGYTKVGVLTPASIERLAQRIPGAKVRFARASLEQAVNELRNFKAVIDHIKQLRYSYVSKSKGDGHETGLRLDSKELRITVNGKSYEVICEEI